MGGPGEVLSETGDEGTELYTMMDMYEGEGRLGANANMMFQDKIRFHDLRHSHASILLSNGINAKIGAERLGHSSVQIYLDRYSHLLPDMQRDAADLIDSKMQMTQKPVTEPTP